MSDAFAASEVECISRIFEDIANRLHFHWSLVGFVCAHSLSDSSPVILGDNPLYSDNENEES